MLNYNTIMTRQRTISFSDSQHKILEEEWKQYNANHTPELNFSQFLCVKLQKAEERCLEKSLGVKL